MVGSISTPKIRARRNVPMTLMQGKKYDLTKIEENKDITNFHLKAFVFIYLLIVALLFFHSLKACFSFLIRSHGYSLNCFMPR